MKKLFTLSVVLLNAVLIQPANSQTWTQQTSPTTSSLFSAWAVDNNTCWMSGVNGVVIRTTNSGTNWILVNNGLAGNDFFTITAIDANTAIVGSGDGLLWRTVNGGLNWSMISLIPSTPFINVVHMFNSNLGFAIGDPSGNFWRYYVTTNGGLNWTFGTNSPASTGTESGWTNSYEALDTSFIIWTSSLPKIYKGSFMSSFTPVTTPGFCYGICFNDGNTGVTQFQSSSPVQRTSNGGTSWTSTGFTPSGTTFVLKSVHSTGYMWIGTSTNIYGSSNSGSNWNSQLPLPGSSACYALTFFNINRGWAGTQSGKLFIYQATIGINPINNETPRDYKLEQNFPNPFNPTTTIHFSIPKASNVSIKIYDVLGNEVTTVASEFLNAGNYSSIVDASSLASGIYYYSLITQDYTESKKMVLIK